MYKPDSPSCAVAKSENSGRPLDNETWHIDGWPQQKLNLPKFGFRTRATGLWPMESFIQSAKFDCPVARQNIWLLATAHDGESGS